MRRTRTIPPLFRTLTALLVALALTFSLFLGLARLTHLETRLGLKAAARAILPGKPGAQVARRPVKVKFVGPRKMLARKVEKPPEQKKLKPVDKLTGQVVETAKPMVEQAPDRARYLGRYDMTVEREIKSKGRKAPGRDLGKVQIERPSPIQSPQSTSKAPTTIPRESLRTRAATGATGRQADAVPPTLGPGPAPPASQEDEAPAREGSVVVKGRHDGLLLPATSPGNVMHNIQALAGNPGSNDYLPDVEDEGETNLLNTRKFRYWDFFQRVKDRVASEWEPGAVWRGRDPQGNRYGVRDRLTILKVTLDPDGALKHVAVAQRSGLEFLDDEARRAFAAAGPFPNPPVGLRNDRGEIEFEFGFMFEISTRRFKFYRVQQ